MVPKIQTGLSLKNRAHAADGTVEWKDHAADGTVEWIMQGNKPKLVPVVSREGQEVSPPDRRHKRT
jgi:hypothetical protein